MAKITLGLATSHGPMLSTPPDQWGERAAADRERRQHHFRGGVYTFDQLVEARKDERLERHLGVEIWHARHRACQTALARLADIFQQARPDVAVILGNDQRELFVEDNIPAFCVYWGERIDNIPFNDEQKKRLPPGIEVAELGHHPPSPTSYPGLPTLGGHLIESLNKEGFDISQSRQLPPGSEWSSGIPHAYGFVYRQIMQDQVIPNVPVILNTFFPPNQPTVKRCHRLGKALRRAIESWEDPRSVALIASGGLSHFVLDEELDQRVLAAMKAKDARALLDLPASYFQSGTSEIKNWIPLAAALEDTDLEMELVGYVPCYRSQAGTGNAMGFAVWR